VSEEAMTASSKSRRADQRPLDKISLLTNWTTVPDNTTDHTDTNDQLSNHDDDQDLRTGPNCSTSDYILFFISLCRGYTRGFLRPRCRPTSPSLPRVKNLVREKRTEMHGRSLRFLWTGFCCLSAKRRPSEPRTMNSVRVAMP